MSELPTATATGGAAEPLPTDVIVAVRPRRVGVITGVLAGLYLFALAVVSPIPNRLVALLGGPGDDFGRYGGMRMVWIPPDDVDARALAERFAEREHGASLVGVRGAFEVEVPHVAEADVARTAQRIAGEGRLEFHEVVQVPDMKRLTAVLGLSMRGKTPVDLAVDSWRAESDGTEQQTDYYLAGPTRKSLQDKLLEAGKLGWSLPDGVHIAFEHLRKGDGWRTYVLSNVVALDGQSIDNATGTFDPYTQRPIVMVELDRDGARRFGELTGRIRGKKLAIVLDGEIRSAPVINDRIAGGRASITMGTGDPGQMERDRDELVTVLRAGALPPGGKVMDIQFVPAASSPPSSGSHGSSARSPARS